MRLSESSVESSPRKLDHNSNVADKNFLKQSSTANKVSSLRISMDCNDNESSLDSVPRRISLPFQRRLIDLYDVDDQDPSSQSSVASIKTTSEKSSVYNSINLCDVEDDENEDEYPIGNSSVNGSHCKEKQSKLPPRHPQRVCGGKGLRHFSSKVSDQVKLRGVTTYLEVANHLVQEFNATKGVDLSNGHDDEKNIRRRVYDALNVLLALNIISKDRKSIRWVGIPSDTSHTAKRLESEVEGKRLELKRKHEELAENVLHLVSTRSVKAVMESKLQGGKGLDESPIVRLPFVMLTAPKDTVVKCEIRDGHKQVSFSFSNNFRVDSESSILKRMGLQNCTPDQLKTLIEPEFHNFLQVEPLRDDDMQN